MWGHLHRCFNTAPNAPRTARRCISDWLRQLGWTGPDHDDVVLAVSEAITNAVEHAYPPGYPGTITMDAATLTGPNGTQRVHITVTDQGIWRNPDAAPALAGTVPVRGRGLAMIRAAMAHLQLDTNATGTRVAMMTRPADPIIPATPSESPLPQPHARPASTTNDGGRRPQVQQTDSLTARTAGRGPQPGRLRAISGGRSPGAAPSRRLLVDLAESRRSTQAGWTADLRTTGIPALHTPNGPAIHVGWHAELEALIEELRRILSALRQWWPDLDVRFSLRGSAAAAHRIARLNGLTLPR